MAASKLNPSIIGLAVAFLGRLRFPILFAITAVVFVVNLFVPDPIPLVDDLFLALVTALLASLKREPRSGEPESQR